MTIFPLWIEGKNFLMFHIMRSEITLRNEYLWILPEALRATAFQSNDNYFKPITKYMMHYLCSNKRHIERWCCQWCCWAWRCGLLPASLHTQAEDSPPGSRRCRRTTILGRSCLSRPSRPDRAAPLWPAAPRGTRSGPRLRTGTAGLGRRSETPHLEDRDGMWDYPERCQVLKQLLRLWSPTVAS